MQRGTRRTVVRGALLTGGALAAVLVAGCQGSTGASGSATGSLATSDAPITSTSTAQAPPVIATDTQDTNPPVSVPAAAGGGGNAATPKSSTVPECKAGDLKLGVGAADGAAGHTLVPLTFTNTSGSSCVMAGFPGVSFVTGDSGTQVGAPAARTAPKGPQVTLAPGHVASALVQAANPGVYGGGCQATPVRGFRVYAPDDTASMFVPYATTGCANPATIQLQVQTVKPGAGGA